MSDHTDPNAALPEPTDIPVDTRAEEEEAAAAQKAADDAAAQKAADDAAAQKAAEEAAAQKAAEEAAAQKAAKEAAAQKAADEAAAQKAADEAAAQKAQKAADEAAAQKAAKEAAKAAEEAAKAAEEAAAAKKKAEDDLLEQRFQEEVNRRFAAQGAAMRKAQEEEAERAAQQAAEAARQAEAERRFQEEVDRRVAEQLRAADEKRAAEDRVAAAAAAKVAEMVAEKSRLADFAAQKEREAEIEKAIKENTDRRIAEQAKAESDSDSETNSDTSSFEASGSNSDHTGGSITFTNGSLQHDNGVFGLAPATPQDIAAAYTGLADPHEKASFEGYEHELAAAVKTLGLTPEDAFGKYSGDVHVDVFPTVREEGRCGVPHGEDVPVHSFAALQLNFFKASQKIVSLKHSFNPEKIPTIPDREPPVSTPGADVTVRSYSTAAMKYESQMVKGDDALSSDDDNDSDSDTSGSSDSGDDAVKPTRSEAVDVSDKPFAEQPISDPADPAATHKVGASYSYPDPLHMWERARGKRFTIPAALLAEGAKPTNKAPSAVAAAAAQEQQRMNMVRASLTSTHGASTHRVYCSELIDATAFRRPMPAVSMFNNGFLLRLDVKSIASQLETIHGECDPVFATFALFSIPAGGTPVKLSDDFSVSANTAAFYPHKTRAPTNNLRSFVLFVPQEHRKSSLFLLARVARPAGDDFDTYIDLYQRPDRYQQKHLIPMKQETQQLTMLSDVLQEMGWCYFPVSEQGSLRLGPATVEKIFRGSKVVRATEMAEFVGNDTKLKQLKTVPVTLSVNIVDVTNYECSFPKVGAHPRPEETESLIEIRDVDNVKAAKELCRHVPCPLLILGSGYFNAYQNIYYLRLQSLKLSPVSLATKQPSSHRTFVVQVALKATDDSFAEEGLQAVYGSTLSAGFFETSAMTTTVHGAKDFEMNDEIKIQLPAHLTKSHHLFITYWAVNTKKVSSSSSSSTLPRTIKLGHSFIPILNENGSLFFRDGFQVSMISTDQATTIGAGYMKKIAEMQPKDLVNGGTPVLTASCSSRSSVYVTNTTMGQVIDQMPLTLPHVMHNDNVLWETSMILDTQMNCPTTDGFFQAQLRNICTLQLPEVLAFFPSLAAYHVGVIASPSMNVGTAVRKVAFRSMLRIVQMVHQYDSSTKILFRRVGTPAKSANKANTNPQARTAATNVLYTFLSNTPLFNDQPFPVAQGIAELWLLELQEVASLKTPTPEQQGHVGRLTEYSWFLLDLILRAAYFAEAPEKVSSPTRAAAARREVFSESFYRMLEVLLIAVVKKETLTLGTTIVNRVAMFLRQFALRGNRGAILGILRSVLLSMGSNPANVLAALRTFTEHEDAYLLTLPSVRSPTQPRFLMHIMLESLQPLLIHSSREVRSSAAHILFNFALRLVNNRRASGADVARVASSMYDVVRYLSEHWKDYATATTDVPSGTKPPANYPSQGYGLVDRRNLLSVVLWIIFHGGRATLAAFIDLAGAETSRELLGGFLQLLVDAQNAFRFKGGNKNEIRLMEDQLADASAWDSRYSTFCHFIGAHTISVLLERQPQAIRCLSQRTKSNPQVYPFFLLLEAVVSINNSAVALSGGACALHVATLTLFPELVSGKATFMPGMVLLVLRLMSFCAKHARHVAAATCLDIGRFYHGLCGGMSRLRSHMANGLVGVAESKGRDMSKAGNFILDGLRTVARQLRMIESSGVQLPDDYRSRFVDEGSAVSVSSGVRYTFHVPEMPMSDDWIKDHTAYQTASDAEKHAREVSGTVSEEFQAMTDSIVLLFKSVLRVQQDDTMKFKESKCAAYHQIILSFLNQCAVQQGFKWLQRLHETHKANDDNAEAALASVLAAALAYRITEVFYDVKGRQTEGARMPHAIFTHVQWHEFARIVPELTQIVPTRAVYTMVREMAVVGNEAVFTVDGQIQALSTAADLLDKANYAELSIAASQLAARFALAKGDFNSTAALHGGISKLAAAIASGGVKRTQHRYYLVWARMEMEQAPAKKSHKRTRRSRRRANADDGGADEEATIRKSKFLVEPIKKIFKAPFAADRTSFTQQVLQQIGSLLESPQIIEQTESSVDTVPYTKPKRRKGTSDVPVNRCFVTVLEVSPSITEEEGGRLRPYQRTCAALDKTMMLHRFECTSLRGVENITKVNEGLAGSHKAVKQVSQVDPMALMLERRVFTLARAFPCTTTAIDVLATDSSVLDPFQTAAKLTQQETAALSEAPANVNLIVRLYSALTPLNIVPAGQYYKQVVATMSADPPAMEAVRAFIVLCKKRMDECLKLSAMEKAPEKCANVLKAIADMECAVLLDREGDK